MKDKVVISYKDGVLTVKQGKVVIKARNIPVDELCNNLNGICGGAISSFRLKPVEPAD